MDFTEEMKAMGAAAEFVRITNREAAEFYGVSVPAVEKWRALGRKAGDPVPLEKPAQMPAWFARMKASGIRRHRCPEMVEQRAREAMERRVEIPSRQRDDGLGLLLPVADSAPEADSAACAPAGLPGVSREDGQAAEHAPMSAVNMEEFDASSASDDDISQHYRQMISVWRQAHREAITAGDFVKAREAQASMDAAVEKLRAWERDLPKRRENNSRYLPREEVRATFYEAMSRLWKMVRRELSYDPQSAERMNALHDRLDELLDEVWGMREESKRARPAA